MHIIELQREDIEIKQEIIELMEKDRTAEEQARLEELKHE